MSRTYSAIKNKHQKHLIDIHEGYLSSPNEPLVTKSTYTSNELHAVFLENIAPMKQEFRHLAQRMRNKSFNF